MATCPRCGRENPPENVYCGRCGLELASYNHAPDPDEEVPCPVHPKELTRLRCGKCDRPICHKCTVISPAGTRCRECSKSQVPVRPGAVVYEARRGVMSLFRMGPYTIWIWILVLSFVIGAVRTVGCGRAEEPYMPEPPPFDAGEGQTPVAPSE